MKEISYEKTSRNLVLFECVVQMYGVEVSSAKYIHNRYSVIYFNPKTMAASMAMAITYALSRIKIDIYLPHIR